MPTIQANGLPVAYTVEGAGPPLVMLHGATSSAREDWLAQIPSFRRVFRLYLPDARGHADTVWDPAGGFTSEMLVEDLRGFADALGLTTFHLVGFSMGAMTALRFAVRHGERIRTLVLVGVDPRPEPRTSVSRHLLDPERIEREAPKWAAELERRHAPQGRGAWRRLLVAVVRGATTEPPVTALDLRRVTAPALVVVGDRDPFVPVSHAEGLFRQLPDARLLVAPDCDHRVQVVRPGLFNEACAAFYRSTEPLARARAEGRPAPVIVGRPRSRTMPL